MPRTSPSRHALPHLAKLRARPDVGAGGVAAFGAALLVVLVSTVARADTQVRAVEVRETDAAEVVVSVGADKAPTFQIFRVPGERTYAIELPGSVLDKAALAAPDDGALLANARVDAAGNRGAPRVVLRFHGDVDYDARTKRGRLEVVFSPLGDPAKLKAAFAERSRGKSKAAPASEDAATRALADRRRALEAEARALEDRRVAEQRAVDSLLKRKADLEASLASLEKRLTVVEVQRGEAERALKQVSAEGSAARASLEQREKDLSQRVASLEAAEKKLAATVASLDEKKARAEKEIAALDKKQKDSAAELSALAKKHDEEAARLRSLEQRVAAASQNLEKAVKAREAELKRALVDLEEKRAEAEQKLAALSTKASALAAQVASLDEKKASLSRVVADLDRAKATREADLRALDDKQQKTEARLASLIDSVRRDEARLADAQRRAAAEGERLAALERRRRQESQRVAALERQGAAGKNPVRVARAEERVSVAPSSGSPQYGFGGHSVDISRANSYRLDEGALDEGGFGGSADESGRGALSHVTVQRTGPEGSRVGVRVDGGARYAIERKSEREVVLTLFDTRAANLDVRRILDARDLRTGVLRVLPHIVEGRRHRVELTIEMREAYPVRVGQDEAMLWLHIGGGEA